jgi:multidrug resistance protein, MATE family
MTQQAIADSSSLSKYPPASARELLMLSLPLILSLFSASFMGFCDRIFLARYSLASLEGCVSSSYLCLMFQHPVIRIVSMAQVFVGLFLGSRQYGKIGPTIWQMIWLSFLSMIITYPCSQWIGPQLFQKSSVGVEASVYFNTLMAVSFLYPLGTTLSSFFIGQGRMKIIFLSTIASHAVNIVLDYLFIFGIDGLLPPQGVYGAAVATAISQCVFCMILFWAFLRKKEREKFGTGQYRFNLSSFWKQLRIGLPRAAARIITLSSWVAVSQIMTIKGGDHLIVLSFGGSMLLLFTFINDGMLQGMITIASNLMGTKDYDKIWKLVRSGFILLFTTTALLSIPYLIFPHFTLSLFFSSLPTGETYTVLKNSCIWLWIFYFCYGFGAIGLSLITASRDLAFHLWTMLFTWVTATIPIYYVMHYAQWSADKMWLMMAFDCFFYSFIFLYRSSKEKWKLKEAEFEPIS